MEQEDIDFILRNVFYASGALNANQFGETKDYINKILDKFGKETVDAMAR